MLAFSEACERNKQAILGMLRDELAGSTRVFEIGSGTGQHAVYFARHLQHVVWQPTDRAEYLPDLAARIAEEGTPNLLAPLELDVLHRQWPQVTADAVYSANTLHIMSWQEVEAFFSGVGHTIAAGGVLAVYGPFRYAGRFTSDSNAAFDRSLRQRDPASGVRDIEAVNRLAETQGLALTADHAMPANNQLVVWTRGRPQTTRA